MATNPEKLKELLKLLSEGLSREEFNSRFAEAIKLIVASENKLVQKVDTYLKDNAKLTDEMRKEVRTELNKLFKEQRDNLNFLQDKVRSLKNGKKGDKGDPGKSIKGDPGKPGKPGKDGSPDTPEQVRDKLETLEGEERLDWKAIRGLEERLKKIESSGATANPQVSHWPIHEQFTMNGSDTTVSLQQAPSANGKALWVHYNGQFLALSNTYTVNGNKITFDFTPEADTTIEVIYIP